MKTILAFFAFLLMTNAAAQDFDGNPIPCEDYAKVFKCRIPPDLIPPGGEIFEVVQRYDMCVVNAGVLKEVLRMRYIQKDENSIPDIVYDWVPVEQIRTHVSTFDERTGCYVVMEYLKPKYREE